MFTRLEEFRGRPIDRRSPAMVFAVPQQILPSSGSRTCSRPTRPSPAATVPVVVYTEGNRSVALAVERIIDIV